MSTANCVEVLGLVVGHVLLGPRTVAGTGHPGHHDDGTVAILVRLDRPGDVQHIMCSSLGTLPINV